ncbi:MAG: phytoene desaturase family protein [Gemmataceae bacterium]
MFFTQAGKKTERTATVSDSSPTLKPAKRCWDVICLGSGMGSLAAAAALAKCGRSVLVLEAHSQLGGMTHTFKRKGMCWGTGFHYTSWPTAYKTDFPELWHILTGGKAEWSKLPDNAENYIRPDGSTFVKYAPRERYRDELYSAFPDERQAIDRYFHDLREISGAFERFSPLQALPPMLERCGLGWWLGRRFLAMDCLPLTRYMDQIGASEQLRDHLWFTWGNYGGIPSDTSIGSHSIPQEYMLDGHRMLTHGSQSAAPAFAATITAAGGELRRNSRVTGLIFEGGRVVGVKVNDEEIRGRAVMSGIGPRETYRLLVPPERRPAHAERIMAMRPSCSIYTIYLALDRQVIERYGLTGVNYFAEFQSGGIRQHWTDLDAPPPWAMLSMAGRFHSQPPDPNVILADMFLTLSAEQFVRWQGTRVMKRGEQYDQLKAQMNERVFAEMERFWPGFRQHIRYAESSTPLTIEAYTNHFDGAAYGIAPFPGRYSERALRVLSGIPGLLLTGQDVITPSVIGAFYGGVTSASALMRRNLRSVLARKGA